MLKGDVPGGREHFFHTAHQQLHLPYIWKVMAVILLQNYPKEAKVAANTHTLRGWKEAGTSPWSTARH